MGVSAVEWVDNWFLGESHLSLFNESHSGQGVLCLELLTSLQTVMVYNDVIMPFPIRIQQQDIDAFHH